jgi:hypothetical protein
MPTTILPEVSQKCPQKDMVLFVQELVEPLNMTPKSIRLAFLCYFQASATPSIQFVCTVMVVPTQPVTQVFLYLCAVLGIPNMAFNVYCEAVHPFQPVHQGLALLDLGIPDSAVFVFEPVVPIQVRFAFGYCKPPADDAISYYTKFRQRTDLSAAEFFERRFGQLRINVCRFPDAERVVCTVTAPETLPVAELPEFLVFAAKENFDAARDTFQLFRQKVGELESEVVPYPLKQDATLKMMLVSRIRPGLPVLLFYDILKGISGEQLKMMVVRTCDIYAEPLRRIRRIRYPMKATDPLSMLVQHIQKAICPCSKARLLLDVDGCVSPIDTGDAVDDSAILRFDVVPPDQIRMGRSEYLVVALLCRYTKNGDSAPSLKQSFLFKIVPGEVVERTKARMGQYRFTDDRLLKAIVFQANGRILNDDETLEKVLRPYDLLKVIQPDKASANNLLKSAKGR